MRQSSRTPSPPSAVLALKRKDLHPLKLLIEKKYQQNCDAVVVFQINIP